MERSTIPRITAGSSWLDAATESAFSTATRNDLPSTRMVKMSTDLIVLDCLRDLPQIGGQALAVKFPHQYFGKSRLRSGTAGSSAGPIAGVMNREGRFIQIALELKSSLPDEAFIFRDRG